MKRREALKMLGVGAAAMAMPRGIAAITPRRKRPNVLFLFTDDQREDTVAALGNPHIITPSLDGLVKEGFAFTNAYCMGGNSGAVCLPSRKMLLRGRSWFSVDTVPPNGPCFPATMNEAGYVTYHHGKRGNTDKWAHGFFSHSHYLDDRADRTSGYPGKPVADDAVAFLQEHKKSGGGKPFFVYLAFGNPHDPRVAAKEYLDLYDPEKIPLPPNFLPFHPFDNGEMTIRDEGLAPWPRTPEVIREHLRDYYAVVTALDAQIGRILAALKEIGEYDNTIILFSSDQGIAIGSHGLMGKQNLYEHSMGVPLVFTGPGIPKGKSSDAFAYLFDIYPTVCELVGAETPKSLEGKSLAGVVQGTSAGVRDTILLAYKNIQRAVRRGRWKLIRYPEVNVTQLFDLEADPYETKNLADDPAQAEKVKELMGVLAEEQKRFGDKAPLTVDNPMPATVDLSFFKRK
jgi:arylsulfatase A-like enzyme